MKADLNRTQILQKSISRDRKELTSKSQKLPNKISKGKDRDYYRRGIIMMHLIKIIGHLISPF
jgi:hypothetical protein